MAFFQNVFDQEYQGYLVLADRRLSPTFKVAPNKNLQSKQVAWNLGPYDLSSGSELKLNFSWDHENKAWCSVSIDVAGSDVSATTAAEVAAKLNSDATFSSMLGASVDQSGRLTLNRGTKRQNLKYYFSNSGAEVQIGMNKMAGVSEMPEYFGRHTVSNVGSFSDCAGMLVRLDETDPVDRDVISAAGFNPDEMKEDWELLRGRGAGLFTFRKTTVDGNDRVTESIEYPAGAVAGDFAKKTKYVYSGSNKTPSQVMEIPYVLQESDLLNP